MKKSLLALAVLGAFAGVASAQSSVTLYGRVDLSFAKNEGSDAKAIQNGSNSRLGFRGVEDLGGGMSALFNLEMGYNADTGAQKDPARFFNRLSVVGLKGGFGQVLLGRNYTTSYSLSQSPSDPWSSADTVVAGIGVPTLANTVTGGTVQLGTSGITELGIATVRNDSSVTYSYSDFGFTGAAQIAEANDTITHAVYKPFNAALAYAGGPISGSVSYERTGYESASGRKSALATANLAYDFGVAKLGAFFAKGVAGTNLDLTAPSGRKSYMVTATAPIGAGELRFAYGEAKYNTVNGYEPATKPLGVGYHYSLSKRTTVYTDYLHDGASGIVGPRSAYDFGIKHNF